MAPKTRTTPLAEKGHLSFFLSTDIKHPISPFISIVFVIHKYGSFTSASPISAAFRSDFFLPWHFLFLPFLFWTLFLI